MDDIATIAAFLPHLHAHLADDGLQMTTSGYTITPEWSGLTITAYAVDQAGNDVTRRFTARDAELFLSEIAA